MIIFGGFLLRISLIHNPVWIDESFTGIFIRSSWLDLWTLIRSDIVHPPLYYFTLKAWTQLFGTDLISIRVFSLIPGILTIILSTIFTYKVTISKFSTILVTLLFSFSPFFTLYSTEARSYALVGLLSVILLYLATSIINRPTFSTIFAFIIISILLLATHYMTLVLIGTVVISLLLIKTNCGNWIKNNYIPFLVTAIIILFLPFTLKTTTQFAWIVPASLIDIPNMLSGFLSGVNWHQMGTTDVLSRSFFTNTGIFGLSYLALIIVYFVQIIIEKRKLFAVKDKQILLYILTTLLPLMSTIYLSEYGLNTFVPRYFIFCGVALLFSIAFILPRISSVSLRIIFAILFITSVIFPTYPKQNAYLSSINERVIGYSTVVVTDPFDFVNLKYLLTDKKVLILTNSSTQSYGSWPVIPKTAEISDISQVNNGIMIQRVPKETQGNIIETSDDSNLLIEEIQ